MRISKYIISFLAVGFLAFSLQAKEKVYKLKMATSFERTVPFLGDVAYEVKELAEKMSNGRLQIRVDAPSKHKAGLALMDLVKAKQYDIGYTVSYYYKGKDFKLVFFTTMPFGMLPNEQDAWYDYGGGKEIAQKVYAKYGLLSFKGGNTGMQMGGWFKKEIKSIDDLKGLKIRIPGHGGEVMSRAGANALTVPLGELYMSLEMGTIDAVEWISPVFDMSMGFNQIAKYYYTGWQEPASETQHLINKKSFDKLPKDLQEILKSAIANVATNLMIKTTDANIKAWNEIKTKYPDIKVLSFPKDVLDALKKANLEILEEQAKKDPVFKELLDSQKSYLKKAREWTEMGNYSYINNTKE